MKHFITALIIIFLIIPAAFAQDVGRSKAPDARLVKVDSLFKDLERPIYITNAGDGSHRLFVVQQQGVILIIKDDELLDIPFLDITKKVAKLEGFTEQGLLGLAFHPDFAENGRFFVDYTAENDQVYVVEYRVSKDNPNTADVNSAKLVMQIPHPGTDHNGGQLVFGPDGYFYIGVGDGGGFGDPDKTAQNLMSPLGKILRINVEDQSIAYKLIAKNPFVASHTGLNEIWAYGLRNPSRFSFDSLTGDMYISDAGQADFEEINFVAAGDPGGKNFGWSHFEGMSIFNPEIPEKADMIFPTIAYGHTEDRCAITGGQVYRGNAIPDLQGVYLYADWCSGDIYVMYRDEASIWQNQFYKSTALNITGIGLDESGEIYFTYYRLADMKGGVLKLVSVN